MIPRAIREQAERADALHAQLTGKTAPAAPVEPPTAVVEPPAPPTEPPTAAVVTPPVEKVPEAPVAPVADPTWEEKYRVLAGKYSAEVPRFAEQVRELKATVTKLEEKAKAAPDILANSLTPAEVVEQFGDDWAKAVAAIVDQRAGRIQEDVNSRVDAVASAAAGAARNLFIRTLEASVPDWQTIDVDPRFTAWLDEIDMLSGQPRRYFFTQADQSNDADRIVALFKTFRASTQPPVAAAPVAPELPARMGVEYALSPASNRAVDAPPGKKLWTQAEIRGFYANVRRGKFTAQDVARIESDIFAAQRENRIAA